MLDHSISIAQQHPGTKRKRNLVQSELPRFMWTNNQQPTINNVTAVDVCQRHVHDIYSLMHMPLTASLRSVSDWP